MIEEYNYNGFKYIKDYRIENGGVKIQHNKEIPEFLYKYYSVTKYSVDALKNNYLYASHPMELNDVLDCSSFFWITNENIEFLKFKKLLYPNQNNIQVLEELYENDKENNFSFYCSESWVKLSNLFGVISLSENRNCPLMWPHYTEEKGFQLKFKTKDLIEGVEENNEGNIFKGLNPINYSDELSPINLNEFSKPFIPAIYMMNIKDSKWSYENEWRIIISRVNMGIPFSKGGWLLRDDYKPETCNRYSTYGRNQILDITLGSSFFNTRDYIITRINDKSYLIKIKDNNENWNSLNQLNFLNYIESNLSDRVYQTGVKYEDGIKAKFRIVRTRERLEIQKESDDSFFVKMTGDFTIYS